MCIRDSTCTVEFDDTVDVPVIVTTTMFGSAIGLLTPIDDHLQMETYTMYKQVFNLHLVQAIHSSQEYVCHTVGGVLASNSPYIIEQRMDTSDSVTISTCK